MIDSKSINQRVFFRIYNLSLLPQCHSMLTQPQLLEQEKPLDLFPKFDYAKGKGKFTNAEETRVVSNYYQIELLKDYKTIYQYSIGFEPQLPDDASKVADKLVESVRKELKQKVGLICYKGRMLWGNLNQKLALITKTKIDVKGEMQEYELILKPTTSITVEDFITKDEDNAARFSQILNVNTKNVLKSIGFKELDRGNYYNDEDFDSKKINEAGLSVWRGYQVNLITVASKLYMRVDVCSRVLRLESFLETLKKTNKIRDKTYINEVFKQNSIITRYGTHRIYRIEEIDYSQTPRSTFINQKSQQKQSYIDYFRTVYQCTIKDPDQPLIKVIVKNCQKEQEIFLVPQLVCLTGLTDDQRNDFYVMKAVAEWTKLRVDERVTGTNDLVRKLNKDGSKELMFSVDQKAHQFDSNLIGAPRIFLKNKTVIPNKGQMALRDTLLDPIHLKEYYFVYTSRGERDDQDADATYSMLQQASKSYGIILNKPIFVDIKVNRNQRLSAKDWIDQIEKENKNGKPTFIIFYFNNEEKKDKQLYEKLKSYTIHKLQINSQVITKKTLCVGAKGGLSKASKILLQINDKMGHPLYKVEKQHPFWGKNTIAIGSLSSSGGPKGSIASFVGTRNNDLTQHCSDFAKIDKKQKIPDEVISQFISGWLKEYYKTQGKKLPNVLFIYRDGLNEKQVGKILEQEIREIERTFEQVAQKAKINGWKPKLVYINVTQKTGTRAYDMDRGGRLSNPLPGTIIGSDMSKDGSYEFLMASAATTQGTCNMVQYKVAYDSSKQDIPHEALKIITYEQCYNYPNWAGSIRFPAPLQKATKLAKFVSTQGVDKIDKANALKSLDYYI